MNDFVKEIVKQILKKYKIRASEDVILKEIKKLEKLDYTKIQEYAEHVGLNLGEVIAEVLKETLGNEKILFGTANTILNKTLKVGFDDVSKMAYACQKQLNQKANINLGILQPSFNEKKTKGMAEVLASKENIEEAKDFLIHGVENFNRKVVDDFIEKNANFHYKSGLSPKITRTAHSGACKWCQSLAGIYDYPNVPKDVYRRHTHCHCIVDYLPIKGKRQNVRTKELRDVDESAILEKRKIKISNKQFGKKAGYHMQDFDLKEYSKEDRDKFKKIIETIYNKPSRIVENITWRGQNFSVTAYIKGEDVVLVNKDNEFITILKGGVNNARIKNKGK